MVRIGQVAGFEVRALGDDIAEEAQLTGGGCELAAQAQLQSELATYHRGPVTRCSVEV